MDWINLTAAAGSAGAAIFAGLQIKYSRKDANRRASLDFLGRVDSALQRVWSLDIPKTQGEILESYKPDGVALSEHAQAYLGFLNTLDLLSYAIRHDLIDKNLAEGHLSTLLTQSVVSLSFLVRLRGACHDQHVYEDLGKMLVANNRHPGIS